MATKIETKVVNGFQLIMTTTYEFEERMYESLVRQLEDAFESKQLLVIRNQPYFNHRHFMEFIFGEFVKGGVDTKFEFKRGDKVAYACEYKYSEECVLECKDEYGSVFREIKSLRDAEMFLSNSIIPNLLARMNKELKQPYV